MLEDGIFILKQSLVVFLFYFLLIELSVIHHLTQWFDIWWWIIVLATNMAGRTNKTRLSQPWWGKFLLDILGNIR